MRISDWSSDVCSSDLSTDERIQKIAQVARGYVYYVSLRGVTGAGNIDTADVAERLAQIRRHVSIPVGVGFGIRDRSEERRVGKECVSTCSSWGSRYH